MNQTFAPINNKLSTDVIIARKNIFSTKVIDTIVKTIENTITNCPEKYKSGDSVLDLFSDVIYDANGLKRLIKFDQYGTFYIAEVFDVYSEKYIYVVYSVFDMIDYFNNNSKNTVPYVKLYESTKNNSYTINKVSKPLDYTGEAVSLNEKGKYIADFGDEKVEFYISLQVSCVSSNYVKVDNTGMQENVCGKVKFVVGDFYSVETFCYAKKEIENTEYSEIYDYVVKDRDMSEFAPYGIDHWVISFPNDPDRGELFSDTLKDIPTENGYILLTAHIKDPFVKVNFHLTGCTATPDDDEISPEDNFITLIKADAGKILNGSVTINGDGVEVFSDTINHQETYSINLDKTIVENCYTLDVYVTAKDNDVITIAEDLTDCVNSNESLTAIPEEDYTATIIPNEGKVLSGNISVSIDDLEILSDDIDGLETYPFEISKEVLTEAKVKTITIKASSRDPKKIKIEKNLTGCYLSNTANDIDDDEDYVAIIYPNDGKSLSHLVVKLGGMDFMDEDITGSASYSLSIPKEVLEELTSISITASAN